MSVCRLCLATDNLSWIFDVINESLKMKDVVYVATGIEIHKNDVISQQICDNCYKLTNKMFQFRSKCLESEKFLKGQNKKYFENKRCTIPNTQIAIKNIENQISSKPKKLSYCIHPSVSQLYKMYPQIKLPVLCLKLHVAPVVVMEMDGIESYFKNRNLDINVHIESALTAARNASWLTKLKELTSKTEQRVLRTHRLKNKCIKCLNNDSTRTKRNVGTKACVKTCQYNNSSAVKSNEQTRIIKTKKFVEIDSVKRRLKGHVNTNRNDTSCAESKTKSQQTLSPSKFNRKRKLSKMTTESDAKRLKLQESLDIDMPCTSTEHSLNIIDLSEIKETTATNGSLDLTTKEIAHSLDGDNSSESLSYIDKSVLLHICDICNSVQYSAKRLRKHRIDHLRCHFCKVRFRTLPKKIHHIKSMCIIKKAMSNMPDIKLERVEYDGEIRRKYPGAFINFPPLENLKKVDQTACDDIVKFLKLDIKDKFEIIRNNMIIGDRSCLPLTKQASTDINNTLKDGDDVILSYEDESCNTTGENHMKESDSAKPSKNPSSTCPSDQVQDSLISSNMNIINMSLTNNRPEDQDVVEILSDEDESCNTIGENHMEQSDSTKSSTNPPSISPSDVLQDSLISPNINIKNINQGTIDLAQSDVEIMKKLLNLSQTTSSFNQRHTQTQLPTNNDITMSGMEIILKDLKELLKTYKIPVIIRFGELNVSYDYNIRHKQCSKLCFWNDLTPIDIEPSEENLSFPTLSDETIGLDSNSTP